MKKVMKNKKVIAMMVVGLVAIFLATSGVVASPPMFGDASPVASTINYQGQLTDPDTGIPYDGTYDMEFLFYDAATGGSQVGSTITENDVEVTNGLFSVKLEVDQSDFNGQGLWIEVKVEGEVLNPRQEILPVPYALSLKPGAEIAGEVPGDAVLSITNISDSGYVKGISVEVTNDAEKNYGGIFKAAGDNGIGVFGWATGSDGHGVSGYTAGVNAKAVYGRTDGEEGTGGYFYASGTEGTGVFAQATGSSGTGVVGWGSGANGCGGEFIAGGKGILAKGAQYAADLQGKVAIRSYISGALVMELGEGLDYAEGFDVSDKKDIGPGSVLIIDPNNPGKLTLSDISYDSKVAGIVAGAKEFGSGIRLGAGQFDYDVALAGRVYCNVDATEAAVEPGDLLTTSATPGYAMKVTDYGRAQGAILGKAMEGLEKGQRGQILVLVTLQ